MEGTADTVDRAASALQRVRRRFPCDRRFRGSASRRKTAAPAACAIARSVGHARRALATRGCRRVAARSRFGCPARCNRHCPLTASTRRQRDYHRHRHRCSHCHCRRHHRGSNHEPSSGEQRSRRAAHRSLATSTRPTVWSCHCRTRLSNRRATKRMTPRRVRMERCCYWKSVGASRPSACFILRNCPRCASC
jgi:hypothetical protein